MATDEDFSAFRARLEGARGVFTGQTVEGLISEMRATWAPIFDAIERMNREAQAVSGDYAVKIVHLQPGLLENKIRVLVKATRGEGVEQSLVITLSPDEALIADKSDLGLTGNGALVIKASGDVGAGAETASSELVSLIGQWFSASAG